MAGRGTLAVLALATLHGAAAWVLFAPYSRGNQGFAYSSAGNADDASGSATTLWFIGLYSTSGVDATNTSQATQVAMGSAEGHGYAALCDTAGTFVIDARAGRPVRTGAA